MRLRRYYAAYEFVLYVGVLAIVGFIVSLQFPLALELTCQRRDAAVAVCTLAANDTEHVTPLGAQTLTNETQRHDFYALLQSKVHDVPNGATFLAQAKQFLDGDDHALSLATRCGTTALALKSPAAWLLLVLPLLVLLGTLRWVTVTVDGQEVGFVQSSVFGGDRTIVQRARIRAVRAVDTSVASSSRSPGRADIVLELDDGTSVSITGRRRNLSSQSAFAASIQEALGLVY